MVVTTYQEETREVLENFWHTSLAKNTAEVIPAICVGGAFLRLQRNNINSLKLCRSPR